MDTIAIVTLTAAAQKRAIRLARTNPGRRLYALGKGKRYQVMQCNWIDMKQRDWDIHEDWLTVLGWQRIDMGA